MRGKKRGVADGVKAIEGVQGGCAWRKRLPQAVSQHFLFKLNRVMSKCPPFWGALFVIINMALPRLIPPPSQYAALIPAAY